MADGDWTQPKRVNPFTGLMLDADTWRDAHDYHRAVMGLHLLTMHGTGVAAGLDIVPDASDRAGRTLNVSRGVAVDSLGRMIVVAQPQQRRIGTERRGTIYLLLEYREVYTRDVQQSAEGVGQPTRVNEVFQLQERDRVSETPHVELVRIEFDPHGGPISMPRNPSAPGVNELDFRSRVALRSLSDNLLFQSAAAFVPPSVSPPPAPAPDPTPPPAPSWRTSRTLRLGLARHDDDEWDLHADGLRFLIREVQVATGQTVQFSPSIPISDAENVDFLMISGHQSLSLTEDDQRGIGRMLDRGGTVFTEVSRRPEQDRRGSQFAAGVGRLAHTLGRPLSTIARGHPLLTARHVFSVVPPGADGPGLFEQGGLIYSEAGYGSAWSGGLDTRPLDRSTIRDALDFGVNMVLYRESHL